MRGTIIRYLKLGAHSDWVVKGVMGELWSAEWGRRELEFQRDNPPIEQLRPVFELACVEYGRIDYALANGRPQVFEINTNQMLDTAPAHEPLHQQAQTQFLHKYVNACLQLDSMPQRPAMLQVPGARGTEAMHHGCASSRNAVTANLATVARYESAAIKSHFSFKRGYQV